MVHLSKSLGSFKKALAQDTDPERRSILETPQPVRRRSSLDTLVIPNRIRVPSNRPTPLDVQVAHKLMSHNATEAGPSRSPLIESLNFEDTHRETNGRQVHDSDAVDKPATNGHNMGRASRERRRQDSSLSRDVVEDVFVDRGGLIPSQTQSGSFNGSLMLDGTSDGRDHSSRLTSTTFSTVTRRVFSDPEASSINIYAQHFNDKYNHLAAFYGLSHAHFTDEGSLAHPEVHAKTTEHKDGWWRRRLFRRPSMTFSYKVKTTYKPLKHKRSLARLQLSASDSRRDIFQDKDLDEICRLGGIGSIRLPHAFATGSLPIPSSLAAAGQYLLLNGLRTPGLFRIPGQTTLVNELYEYFACKFHDAGSPSKVQATIQTSALPTHLSFTQPDVASVLKRIVGGLPGGLLGSVETFEAIRTVLFDLEAHTSSHDIAGPSLTEIKARLVALVILSCPSNYRSGLIQAMLGLFAVFGHETETHDTAKAQREMVSGKERSSSHDLLDYRGLGVCLGPLLLGDKVDEIKLHETHSGESRASIDTANTSKRRAFYPDTSMKKEPRLEAARERANLLAEVLTQLLSIWRDIVQHLRILQNDLSWTQRIHDDRLSSNELSKCVRHQVSFLDPDADQIFAGIVPARKILQRGQAGLLVKQKIRSQSRIRQVIETNGGPKQVSTQEIDQARASLDLPDAPDCMNTSMSYDEHNESESRPEGLRCVELQAAGIGESHQASVDSPNLVTISSGQSRDLKRRRAFSESTFYRPKPVQSQQGAPSDHNIEQTEHHASPENLQSDNITSLSPFRMALKDDDKTMNDEDRFKGHEEREDSSLFRQHSPLNPPMPLGRSQEDAEKSEAEKHFQFATGRSPLPSSSALSRDGTPKVYLDHDDRSRIDGDLATSESYYSAEHLASIHDHLDHEGHNEYPTTKESYIPRPLQASGQSGRTHRSPPSPLKCDALHSPSFREKLARSLISAETRAIDEDAESFQEAKAPTTTTDFEIIPTKPVSAYTLAALERMEQESAGFKTPHHVMGRSASRERRRSRKLALESPSVTLRRSDSHHATLYMQITRLQRQLEHKEEELMSVRRVLDATRAAQEELKPAESPGRGSRGGSWGKGTLSVKVMQMSKEVQFWKDRAGWAEKRLLAFTTEALASTKSAEGKAKEGMQHSREDKENGTDECGDMILVQAGS